MLAHLLKIEFKKMANYRTFWIVGGLYFLTLGIGAASGMEFLKLLARTFEGFGQEININRIPLYHFPDVWLNLIWVGGFLKVVLAIMIVISATNEFSYRTARQNIIDGLSRQQFLVSKILANVMYSLISAVMLFVIGLVTGLIYSPEVSLSAMFTDVEFFIAYFLEVFFFLSYALMLGILIQRAGLTIILVLLSQTIELIITENLRGHVPDWLLGLFPMKSIWYLIDIPFPRYAFMQIRDYLTFTTIAIVLVWTFLFNYFAFLKLKKSDI